LNRNTGPRFGAGAQCRDALIDELDGQFGRRLRGERLAIASDAGAQSDANRRLRGDVRVFGIAASAGTGLCFVRLKRLIDAGFGDRIPVRF
jgi:hypothetical protein